ncbi:MAG: TlpA family protein disulfide reductase [Proteobacteria bacterium]|nr:TlpA family protein disulfide reductase [Pseudomonadota bacterium]
MNRRFHRGFLAIALSALVPAAALMSAACGDSSDSENGNGNDLEPPAECALAVPPDGWVYPAGPYGTELDDTFADLTLDDCAGDSVVFGDVLGQSELTLFSIGAGWCEPCVDETKTLDAEIFRQFCGRGLRVVQALFQDGEGNPATKLFCSEWRREFSLSFPVVVDPLFELQDHFQSVDSQTPINYLIDRTGRIVFKSTGIPPADLPQRIDSLLPAQ